MNHFNVRIVRRTARPRRATLLLGAVACGTLLSHAASWGWAKDKDSKPAQTVVPATRTFAFVTNNCSDYWTIARRGVERAEHDLKGVKVEFLMPPSGTVTEQDTIMRRLMQERVQGIAVSPSDPDNEAPLLNEIARKTVLITQDSDVPQSKRRCFVGTDNYAAGVVAGQEMKRVVPYGGEIALFVGKRDTANARERERGIRAAFQDSAWKIVEVFVDDTERLRAKANAATAMVKYPRLQGMIGLWSYNGPQILAAVRDAHKLGKVKIVAFDEEDDTLEGVRQGNISTAIVQNPYEIGYQSIKLLDQISRGDNSRLPTNHFIAIPMRAIIHDNVIPFRAELNRLRGHR